MSSHLPVTSSTWVLNETIHKTVTFSVGLLRAATTDNVNPVALYICSIFGSLIPVCTDTRRHIESLAQRDHTTPVLDYIQAQIGWSKNDAVQDLSRSKQGISFLCLVAALCTYSHYDAAEHLDRLLAATAGTAEMDGLRPTLTQLQAMLACLRPKMALSNFAGLVTYFDQLIRLKLQDLSGFPNDFKQSRAPSGEALQDLLIAINKLVRKGDADRTHTLQIRTSEVYAGWACAFVHWLLNDCPIVRTDDARLVLDLGPSPVELILLSEASKRNQCSFGSSDGEHVLIVTTGRRLRAVEEVIFLDPLYGTSAPWRGLVEARAWFEYYLSQLLEKYAHMCDCCSSASMDSVNHSCRQLPGSAAAQHSPLDSQSYCYLRSAIAQALYYIVVDLPVRLVFHAKSYKGADPVEHHPLASQPFLARESRIALLQDLAGSHLPVADMACTMRDHLSPHFVSVNRTYSGVYPDSISRSQFELSVGSFGATLLALTLFGGAVQSLPMLLANTTDDEFASRQHRDWPSLGSFAHGWQSIIARGWLPVRCGKRDTIVCNSTVLFEHVARMMGHPQWKDTDSTAPVISSSSGQVLAPAMLFDKEFVSNGYLRLCAFEGSLRQGEAVFDRLMTENWTRNAGPSAVSHSDGLRAARLWRSTARQKRVVKAAIRADATLAELDRDDRQGPSTVTITVDMKELEAAARLKKRKRQDTSNEHSQVQCRDGNKGIHGLPARHAAGKRRPTPAHRGLQWDISIKDRDLIGRLRVGEDPVPVDPWTLLSIMGVIRVSPSCSHSIDHPAGLVAHNYGVFDHTLVVKPDPPLRKFFPAGQSFGEQLCAFRHVIANPMLDECGAVIMHVHGCIACALTMGMEQDVRCVIS